MTLPRNDLGHPGQGALSDSTTDDHLTLDERHAVWLDGDEHGYARGRQEASIDLACEWLHAQACRYAGIARQTATERHGAQWGETVAQAAEVGR